MQRVYSGYLESRMLRVRPELYFSLILILLVLQNLNENELRNNNK